MTRQNKGANLSTFYRIVFLWLASFCSASLAYSQAQPEQARKAAETQEEDAKDAKLKADEAAKKTNHPWTGSVTIGTQFSQGETDAAGVSMTGDISKSLPTHIYRIFFTGQYASVKVSNVPGRIVAQDRQELTFAFVQKFTPLISFIAQEVGERDRTKGLKYRAVSLNGIGLDVIRTRRVALLLAPGFAFAEENKIGIRKGSVFGPGIFENINVAISPRWTFNEHLMFRTDVEDSKNRIFNGAATLTGRIDRRFGVQAGYIYTFEGEVQPGYHKRLSQLTIGLNVKI